MTNRIKEMMEYKTIKDNPFKLLEEIKKKMYEPGRVKYAWVGFTKQISGLLTTKQEENESLVDYTKRFKQVRDNAKSGLGKTRSV